MSDIIDGPSDHESLAIVAAMSGFLAFIIILPYLQYVLFALILGYLLYPVQVRLEGHMSAGRAAIVLIGTAIIAIIIPIAYLISISIRQGLEFVQFIQDIQLDPTRFEQRLQTIGVGVDLQATFTRYEEVFSGVTQRVVTEMIEFLGGLPNVFIGLTVTLFVLFSLLRDGGKINRWFRRVIPLEEPVLSELNDRLDRLMWASLVGNVAVSGIQAILLGIGIFLLDIPGVVFLTVMTFILALLPLVGAFAVWLPLSIYLIIVGQPVTALILIGYGSIVSASDMYLRPAIIGHSGALSSAIIVVGIFGGIVIFGPVGLFIGPVVLGGTKVVMDLYMEERETVLPT